MHVARRINISSFDFYPFFSFWEFHSIARTCDFILGGINEVSIGKTWQRVLERVRNRAKGLKYYQRKVNGTGNFVSLGLTKIKEPRR